MKLNSILVVGLSRERERKRRVRCWRGEWKVIKEIEIVRLVVGLGLRGVKVFSQSRREQNRLGFHSESE